MGVAGRHAAVVPTCWDQARRQRVRRLHNAEALQAGNRNGIGAASYSLSTYALTGFANLGSIGIQVGGIGAMAPERRSDIARLGVLALTGFLATLLNAAVAGVLM